MTSRELRRMAERTAQRDERQKALDAFWALSPDERARRIADNEAFRRISQNGITLDDLYNAEKEAYAAGVKEGKQATVKTCFAAICLSLHDLHGFGKERCRRVLNDVYDKLTFALTAQDAIQDVYDTLGLEITFTSDVMQDAVTDREVSA